MSALAHRKVLVLNRGWNPVAVIGLERAMCLVVGQYKDGEPKARVLDPTQDFRLFTWEDWAEFMPGAGETGIRASSREFRIPEIILLSRYNKLPQQRIHFSRRTIYRRDGNQCQYCGKKPGTAELTIDHIIPRSQGGKTTWENCCLACVTCNKKKADKSLAQLNMKFFHPGFKPYKPKFTLYKGDFRCKSWEALLGVAYWETELQSDIAEEN